MAESYEELMDIYFKYKVDPYLDFSVIHYENAGELVVKYKYDPLVVWNADINQWTGIPPGTTQQSLESEPLTMMPFFFGQSQLRVRPVRTNSGPTKNFLESRVSWQEGLNTVPYLSVIHRTNNNGTSSLLLLDGSPIRGNLEIKFGEFFLLTNNIKSIKRFNLKTELLQDDNNSTALVNLNTTFSYPDSTEKGKADQFVSWQLGYGPIPQEQRPSFLLAFPSTKPTINRMVHSENRRRWDALREDCVSWVDIFDKSNINYDLTGRDIKPKSTMCNIKSIIDTDKLRSYLEETFDHSSYAGGTMRYDIILYPPSMYLYPADSVITVLEPLVNSVNTFADQIVFEVQNSFKSDGNFHYKIDFTLFDTSAKPVYTTSSYGNHVDHEPDNWFFSIDGMDTWVPILELKPTFDNFFREGHGADANFTTHLKYVFTRELFDIVRDSAIITFKIKQLDGTLVHFAGRKFSLPYDNDMADGNLREDKFSLPHSSFMLNESENIFLVQYLNEIS